MSDGNELLAKLQIKPGTRLLLFDVPPGVAKALAGAKIVRTGDAYDGAIAFCETPADVAAHTAKILAELPGDGLLWFAYRKGAAGKAAGISRDVGWAPLAAAGFRPVRSIAIDEVWTGLRFREISRVKSRG